MLFVVFCCSFCPQQVQTRMKEIYQKRIRRQQQMIQNRPEMLQKWRPGGSWGPSWLQDRFWQQKPSKTLVFIHYFIVKRIKNTREYSNFVVFGPSPGPPKRNPFGSLFASCCHPGAPWGRKCTILGGSGCRVPFWTDFESFLEGSWTAKKWIWRERGSKNDNFT